MNLRLSVRQSLVSLALLPLASIVGQDTGWNIVSFHAEYTVNANRTIDVTERIDVDFGPLQKHGIYRDINTQYRRVMSDAVPIRAGTEKVDIELLGVTDGQQNSLGTSVEGGNQFRVRIGDPDIVVTGPQTYIIRYRIERGVGFFDDHDELYWQVTGTEWPVPILRASARVRLPSHEPADSGYGAWCYAGWHESNDSSRCTATSNGFGEFRFESGRLDPGEGLTLVAAFPKGIVPEPTEAEILMARLLFWWPSALPLVVLVGMFLRWRAVGREPDTGSIMPNWKPPTDLPPGAAGTLLDQRAGMDDIVATLLDLAVRGYITIAEVSPDGLLGDIGEKSFIGKALRSLGMVKNDWEISTTSKPKDDLTRYEQLVLDGVLEGRNSRRMSDLHNDFYSHLPKIYEAMYDETVERGLFERRPERTRNRYRLIGALFLIAAPALGFPLQNGVLALGLGLSGVIIILFANAMPSMTRMGARRWAELKGLEEYIRRAEKLELETRYAPEKTPQLFESLLPYAIALNVSDIWVKQFATVLASQPPTWYVGGNVGQFNIASFQSGLSSFQTAATRTMGSSPGSSSGSGGGGSVGGGGGGGGGGSW
jgi:hypothetical protein